MPDSVRHFVGWHRHCLIHPRSLMLETGACSQERSLVKRLVLDFRGCKICSLPVPYSPHPTPFHGVSDLRVLYLNHLNLKYKTGENSHGKCINRTYFFRGIKQYSSILFLLIIPRLTQDWRNLDAPFSVRENKSATFLRLKP